MPFSENIFLFPPFFCTPTPTRQFPGNLINNLSLNLLGRSCEDRSPHSSISQRMKHTESQNIFTVPLQLRKTHTHCETSSTATAKDAPSHQFLGTRRVAILRGFQTGEISQSLFHNCSLKAYHFQVAVLEPLIDAQTSQTSVSGLILIETNRPCFLITPMDIPFQDLTPHASTPVTTTKLSRDSLQTTFEQTREGR